MILIWLLKFCLIPVFKNLDELSDSSIYRPIIFLPTPGKFLEALINSGLIKYLTSQGLLPDNQYGFRFSRSSADESTVIAERVLRFRQEL